MTTYTHKGWIGLCPVYLGNVGGSSPDVLPRLPATDWLLTFSLWLFDVVARMSPVEDDGSIPIRITGKLAQPIRNQDENHENSD